MKIAFAVALVALVAAQEGVAADTQRGRALYEQNCTGCHGQSVHARETRAAGNLDEVRAWVQRWNASLKLGWNAEEIEDVTAFLAANYYRFISRS